MIEPRYIEDSLELAGEFYTVSAEIHGQNMDGSSTVMAHGVWRFTTEADAVKLLEALEDGTARFTSPATMRADEWVETRLDKDSLLKKVGP